MLVVIVMEKISYRFVRWRRGGSKFLSGGLL